MQGGFNFGGTALRILWLVSRFFLVIYIAKYLSLEELGVFGLFQAVQVIGVQVVGFELHAYATREIAGDVARCPPILWSQARFYAAAYVAALPVVVGLGFLGVVPLWTTGWLIVTLLSGHAVAEMYRVLLAMSHAKAAYMLQFLANGAWVVIVVCLGLIDERFRSLQLVFGSWAAFSFLSTMLGWRYLVRLGFLRGGAASGNWKTVAEGLRISTVFVLGALCMRGIETMDRFFLDAYWGESAVGSYTFYGRIASALHEITFAGVASILFPKLIAAHRQNNETDWQRYERQMLRGLLVSLVVLTPLFVIGMHGLLWFLDRPELTANVEVFYLLVAAYVAMTLGLHPQNILYAWGRDRALAVATFAAALANLVLNLLLTPSLGLRGAAIAFLASMAGWTLLRWLTVARHRNDR